MTSIITDSQPVSPSTRRAIRRRLLDWFAARKRDLPWRETTDPYAVLVSEVMLQQTQVATVIPYYRNFLERFPDFEALAEAAEEEVFRHWAGLGYYRRARSLHQCARQVVSDHSGRFPQTKAAVLALPGIGPYTAGAVLSIAFDQPEPLVDGNVERVLTRLFAVEEDLASAGGKKAVWRIASELVPEKRPGDFNQALMELGATVCKSSSPECGVCPVSIMCRARAAGRVTDFPIKTRNRKAEEMEEAVLLIESNGRWLLTDSNDEGLYGGLWQFPWKWKDGSEGDIAQTARSLAKSFGLGRRRLEPFWETNHAVTFRKIRTHCFHVQVEKGGFSGEKAIRWALAEEAATLGLPSYQKRIAGKLPTEQVLLPFQD